MIFIIIIVIAIIVLTIVTYNELVTLRQRVKNGFGQIDIQLQRRFDLIPNLVETVKGYATHEESTFENIAKMRSAWAGANNIEEKMKINSELAKSINSLYAISENYPDLKANANFMDLQNQLKDIEEKISFSRSFYNDIVTKYNTKIQVFPTNLVASIFKFQAEKLFEIEDGQARNNVKVSFDK